MSHAGERGEKQSCPKTERKTSLLDKQIFSPSNASMKNTMTSWEIYELIRYDNQGYEESKKQQWLSKEFVEDCANVDSSRLMRFVRDKLVAGKSVKEVLYKEILDTFGDRIKKLEER